MIAATSVGKTLTLTDQPHLPSRGFYCISEKASAPVQNPKLPQHPTPANLTASVGGYECGLVWEKDACLEECIWPWVVINV